DGGEQVHHRFERVGEQPDRSGQGVGGALHPDGDDGGQDRERDRPAEMLGWSRHEVRVQRGRRGEEEKGRENQVLVPSPLLLVSASPCLPFYFLPPVSSSRRRWAILIRSGSTSFSTTERYSSIALVRSFNWRS